jgi:branched-chain amino acid transport system substrate-binding protein
MQTGTVFAGWVIESRLGGGGMADVYLARHPRLPRTDVLKVISAHLASDESFRRRFLQEAERVCALEHPNVIVVYDRGEHDGQLYIAMQYIRGGDLRDLLGREGRLPPHRALGIVAQVAAALDAAHRLGLVHRDVKPANVLLAARADDRETDRAVLADFGIARLETGEASTRLTDAGAMVGTPAYAAPEQVLGQAVDGRADVYALGCLLFELLTGSPPFVRDSPVMVLIAHVHDPPPAPSRTAPGLPLALDLVVATALAKDPAQRYPTCSALVEAARAALAVAPLPPATRAGPWQITVRDTGGIDGRDRQLGPVDTARLPGPTAARVGDLLHGCRFWALQAPYEPPVADAVHRRIVVSDAAGRHGLAFSHWPDRPRELDALVDLLQHAGARWTDQRQPVPRPDDTHRVRFAGPERIDGTDRTGPDLPRPAEQGRRRRLITATAAATTGIVAAVVGLAVVLSGGGETGPRTSAGNSASPTAPGGPVTGLTDGAFKVGAVVPETGPLAFLGPPQAAGVRLAVQQINESGGVLGRPVALTTADSGGTESDLAARSVDRLLAGRSDVVIGPAASGVTSTVIDKILAAGVVQISPSASSDAFTTYDDDGLFFRTTPPDVMQARVLAGLMDDDGVRRLAILALRDPYGRSVSTQIEKSFIAAGGEVVETIGYDPQAAGYDAEVARVAAARPDAVAVVGFDESHRVVTAMIEKGIGPGKVKVYGVDGNTGNGFGALFQQKGVLVGMKGVTPLVDLAPGFQERLKTVDPNLKDFNYAGESYDAVTIAALAVEKAGSDAGPTYAKEINGITAGGAKCTSFAACREIIDNGGDPDYDGAAGPLEFVAAGEPAVASFAVVAYQPDNTAEIQRYVQIYP